MAQRSALPHFLTALCVLLIVHASLQPFSGWLPRAMEGPTPTSAVFYGALSVHLGAYLLLRAGPLLEASPVLAGVVNDRRRAGAGCGRW